MKHFTNDFCELIIINKYAILRIFENVYFDQQKAVIIRELCKEHFRNEPFILIHDRKFKHKMDLDLYKKRELKNIKGMAIVSIDGSERENALKEQPLFDESFAFFEKLEDAQNWANSFFI